jgi:two-component system, LytTR family, sensor kinase
MFKEKIISLTGNRTLQHLLFWCFSFIILLGLFTGSGKAEKIDYIYTFLFHLTILPFVYINLMILIPELLSTKRYLFYAVPLLLLIPLSAEINIMLFDRWIDKILPGYYFISYYSFADVAKIVTVYLAITSLLKLSRGWFRLSDANRRLSQLQKEHAEAELKALKGQINPHFLFNSLNGIYSQSLSKSEDTPDTVLKLSEILRYVIYDTNSDFISLSKEVKFLKDYIDLQKIRSDNRAELVFNINGDIDNFLIAPMIFLPLVENSFKHGVKGSPDKSYIKINLNVSANDFNFTIENNKGVVDEIEGGEYKGIGIENVRKRLAMIYPGEHEFTVTDSDLFFRVDIKIKNLKQKDED